MARTAVETAARGVRSFLQRLLPSSASWPFLPPSSSSQSPTATPQDSSVQHLEVQPEEPDPTWTDAIDPAPTPPMDRRNPVPGKENQPPPAVALPQLPVRAKPQAMRKAQASPETLRNAQVAIDEAKAAAARAEHLRFTEEALEMARLALRTNETPVGCVLVHDGKVIAKGMNATNITRNGTRHAEFMALSALLAYPSDVAPTLACQRREENGEVTDISVQELIASGNGRKGHLYPYGQKLHPDARVMRDIIKDCILYVTVEPCVMCASLLRQLNIKKVYFGAVNDKFGGTGGVFSIHANSTSASEITGLAIQANGRANTQNGAGGTILSWAGPMIEGHGGNVEAGYPVEGGWGREEAVGLLRRFYVQENGRAPVPRKKEGRAARLQAMMEKDAAEQAAALAGMASDDQAGVTTSQGVAEGTVHERAETPVANTA